MKSFTRAVDRFCLTHRRFGIQRLMLYIIIGYAASYVLCMILPLGAVTDYLKIIAFSPYNILHGQVWRLVTWVFYPTGGIFYTVLMLYFSYFVGSSLERDWGSGKFTIFYLLGILLSVIYGFIIWGITGTTINIVSDYMNLSLLLAYATMYPNQVFLLFFVLPLKAKWLALFDAGYYVVMIIINISGGAYYMAFLPVVAVLNFFLFCADDVLSAVRPYKVQNSRQAINFRKVAKKKRHDDASRPYRHKCDVCGKTDTDFPNMEFRYCSRCSGYHCYCSEHINSHIHFQ